jgi:hypothetical protein
MKSLIYIFMLCLWAAAGDAQQTVPPEIALPTGSTEVLHVYARGVQVYRCTRDFKDTSRYVWTFQEPRADLFTSADYRQKTGTHFLNDAKNPTWVLSNDDKVSGKKLRQSSSKDSLSIPWLLLGSVPESGKGRLAGVTYIQRLYTQGGVAPAKAEKSQSGKLLEVPYTAEYLFFR